MKVEVRVIDVKKWHGKKGQENFSQPLVLEALYDIETGGYATGLTEDERKKYEKLTGYDLSDKYDPQKPHPFWNSQAARIKLPHRTTIFDTDKPLDFIKVKVLKASKYVANSMKEYEEGLYPEATHVIFDEAEEVLIKAKKIERKNEASALLEKMTLDEKVNIVQILGNKSLRGQSQNFVTVAMDEILENQIDEFLNLAKADKEQTYMRAVILEAIYKGTLTKEGNAILYMGDRVGNDVFDAVEYFLDPQNQIMKTKLLEKLTK